MSIVRFIKCYSHPFIILLTAFLFLIFSGDAEVVTGGNSDKLIDSSGIIYTLAAITFSLLAVWIFSIGALVVLVQLVYGLVKYFSVEENKAVYLHYFYGFAIALFSYIVIFTASTPT